MCLLSAHCLSHLCDQGSGEPFEIGRKQEKRETLTRHELCVQLNFCHAVSPCKALTEQHSQPQEGQVVCVRAGSF